MSELITRKNLEQVIEKNKLIKDDISRLIKDFTVRFNKSGVTGQDKLSFSVLKENHLIQIPIDDEYWGGAIITKGNIKIPVINTAQPRVYQYFVAWHEIYHLLYDLNLSEETHNIAADMDLNERRADYFAAKMIFGNVYDYYYSLDDEDFIDRVIKCMDVYKAPYKAVLIELFEEAVTKYNDLDLKEKILKHFDSKPKDLVQKFIDLELDAELVKPSYVVSLGGLEKKIQSVMKENLDVSYHKDNYQYLLTLKRKIKKVVEGLAK
ncbi:ImmA/IrrE family metallo-endopeptidase [Thermoanaerobacterium thermosaccharolyticum]|uniref:ImmA/IrrE family metallo-endopeptidase n=1 Tax=Thermoanaerobacterium thermosaccharolyticum TaxID=1517 RepID=UPI001053147C|nr:hypothetical protein [Thermoanaerobacterium thermosaccharolyticum]MBE0068587.1 hypothetical protein [Thermoanaerobacterium thermosaccharolyticum]MBE0228602.1 hypothetical protein [Thermoanaerobacterium thermosaccharolyticum]TCW35732.1 hypothetical protein EDC21_11268 [Thermohydrogenium kirishiense]WHE07625.1 hypothetical protein PGH24_02405 [Thermoanaerobacterium thermosaccharolyticum]